jgi:hypothetical protein
VSVAWKIKDDGWSQFRAAGKFHLRKLGWFSRCLRMLQRLRPDGLSSPASHTCRPSGRQGRAGFMRSSRCLSDRGQLPWRIRSIVAAQNKGLGCRVSPEKFKTVWSPASSLSPDLQLRIRLRFNASNSIVSVNVRLDRGKDYSDGCSQRAVRTSGQPSITSRSTRKVACQILDNGAAVIVPTAVINWLSHTPRNLDRGS